MYYKKLFHKYPYRDPKTNEPMTIGGEIFNNLVIKYGQSKIKSPM